MATRGYKGAGRFFFFFSSRRRHTRCGRDWSSDVCSSDLVGVVEMPVRIDHEFHGRAESLERFLELGPRGRHERVHHDQPVGALQHHHVAPRTGEQCDVLGERLRLYRNGADLRPELRHAILLLLCDSAGRRAGQTAGKEPVYQRAGAYCSHHLQPLAPRPARHAPAHGAPAVSSCGAICPGGTRGQGTSAPLSLRESSPLTSPVRESSPPLPPLPSGEGEPCATSREHMRIPQQHALWRGVSVWWSELAARAWLL